MILPFIEEMQFNTFGRLLITYDAYDKIVATCEQIAKQTADDNVINPRLKFSAEALFPSVADLQAFGVDKNFKELLPYLIYYDEVYKTDDLEFKETKDFIHSLLMSKLEFVDEEEE